MIKNVTVFGGANPKAGETAYEDALHLGKLLGLSGYTVLTGGYIGTMEAVSRGAAEAGAHVIGVTCDEIERWRSVQRNAWVQEERHYPTLRQRLYALIEGCDAALALPGGPGTLAEVAVMWNHLLTEAISPRPLILIGAAWKATMEQLFHSFDGYIPVNQRRWLAFAPDAETAVEYLKLEHEK
jgi:uncharacterized protein (TIGR00725 family)